MPVEKFKFEDKSEEIDGEIAKRKGKWQLNALSYMDFDDVSQLLRLHIFSKWDKCAECPLYKKWQGRKQSGYNIKLASSIDSEFFSEKSIISAPKKHLDYEAGASRLHEAMKKELTASQWKVYKLMFIDNMSDDEIGQKLDLKSNEGRKPGYRLLFLLKAKFLETAKAIMEEQDII